MTCPNERFKMFDDEDLEERRLLQAFYKDFVGPRLSFFSMSSDERNRVMDANPPKIAYIHSANLYFDWGWKACGFGQLSFSSNEDGKIILGNEGMSRERVRTLLHALADHIADTAEFEIER